MTLPDETIEFLTFLRSAGLVEADENPIFSALTGGVSSDIWKVQAASGTLCVKRALDKLKVADDWHAPIERNAYEVAWMRQADAVVPGSAPKILAHAPDQGMFAMDYLDPASCRLWKEDLRQGITDMSFAEACGQTLGRIHRQTAGDPVTAETFTTDEIFHAIRLEPYLEATARRQPDVADELNDLVAVTAANRIALVHGDVSPKNLLVTPGGPVFLDAECAWYGDPAFDIAFCLNHLLLKCLWTPVAASGFLACFEALIGAYLQALGSPLSDSVETRAARLLPGLFLGRVDGKSPVEYLTDEKDKNRVRRTAMTLLRNPVSRLDQISDIWRQELGLETGNAS